MTKVSKGFTVVAGGRPSGPTHYQVLGVLVTATSRQIRDAYYKLATKHHPDAGGDAEKFKLVTQAHSVLANAVTRRDYDKRLQLLGVSMRCTQCKGKRRVDMRKGLRVLSVQCPACKGTGDAQPTGEEA